MFDKRAKEVAASSVEDQAKITFHVLASLNGYFRNSLKEEIPKATILRIFDEAIDEVQK